MQSSKICFCTRTVNIFVTLLVTQNGNSTLVILNLRYGTLYQYPLELSLDHHDHSSICLPVPPTLLKDCLLTPVVTCASTSDAGLSPKSICDNVPVGTTATVVALAKTLVLLSLHFTHVNKQLTCTWSYELTFQNKYQSCERMKKPQVPAQGTSDSILYVTRSGIFASQMSSNSLHSQLWLPNWPNHMCTTPK